MGREKPAPCTMSRWREEECVYALAVSHPRPPPLLVPRGLLSASRSAPPPPPRAPRQTSSTPPSPPLLPSRPPPRLPASSPSPPTRPASPAPPTALFSARVRPLAPPARFLRRWPLSPPRIPPPPPPSPHAASSGSVARPSPPSPPPAPCVSRTTNKLPSCNSGSVAEGMQQVVTESPPPGRRTLEPPR